VFDRTHGRKSHFFLLLFRLVVVVFVVVVPVPVPVPVPAAAATNGRQAHQFFLLLHFRGCRRRCR